VTYFEKSRELPSRRFPPCGYLAHIFIQNHDLKIMRTHWQYSTVRNCFEKEEPAIKIAFRLWRRTPIDRFGTPLSIQRAITSSLCLPVHNATTTQQQRNNITKHPLKHTPTTT
jgi:hypothetical protein